MSMSQNFGNSHKMIESVITLVLVFLVMALCLLIISPFLLAILWAVIIAVSVFPLYDFMVRKMKGKRIFPAILITIIMVGIIIGPVIWFFSAAASNADLITKYLHSGELNIATPSPKISEWPLIGKPLYTFLSSLSTNLESLLEKYYPQILRASQVLLGGVLSATMTFLQLLLSVLIAGFLLATKGTAAATDIFFSRIAGRRGAEFKILCVSTIRSVIKGILGVAVIQSILAGVGLFLAGIPYPGILTVICLILAILQVGPGLVILGVIVFLFYTHGTLYAGLWTIYFIGVGFSDNILKPFLLGKGSQVPMLVLFLGVIGGFILYGFIGLFAGPIILSIGYKLILAWMYPEEVKQEVALEVTQ